MGAGVKDLQVGDLVFNMGGHRTFQRDRRQNVVPLPLGLDPFVAVLTRLMGVSMSTLVTTAARPPVQVVVTGLGPVGNLAAQIFHASGYRVLGCDPVEARRKLLADAGIATLPSMPLEDPAYLNHVALVVDCSGHEQAVVDACKLVRKRGEVVLVGVPWKKRTELSAHALLHPIFHRYVVLRSGWEWELPVDPADFKNGCIMENLAAGLDWLHQGRIHTAGFAERTTPDKAQVVYTELLQQRCKTLTVVFDWTAIKNHL